MATNYVQPGDQLTITAGADISSGDVVVVGSLLGIAAVDIKSGATGTVSLQGVYTCPKVAGNAWTVGQALVWDVSESKFDTAAAVSLDTGDVSGNAVAFTAAGSTAATGQVAINRDVGSIT